MPHSLPPESNILQGCLDTLDACAAYYCLLCKTTLILVVLGRIDASGVYTGPRPVPVASWPRNRRRTGSGKRQSTTSPRDLAQFFRRAWRADTSRSRASFSSPGHVLLPFACTAVRRGRTVDDCTVRRPTDSRGPPPLSLTRLLRTPAAESSTGDLRAEDDAAAGRASGRSRDVNDNCLSSVPPAAGVKMTISLKRAVPVSIIRRIPVDVYIFGRPLRDRYPAVRPRGRLRGRHGGNGVVQSSANAKDKEHGFFRPGTLIKLRTYCYGRR